MISRKLLPVKTKGLYWARQRWSKWSTLAIMSALQRLKTFNDYQSFRVYFT